MGLTLRPGNTTYFVSFYQVFWHKVCTEFLHLNSLETQSLLSLPYYILSFRAILLSQTGALEPADSLEVEPQHWLAVWPQTNGLMSNGLAALCIAELLTTPPSGDRCRTKCPAQSQAHGTRSVNPSCYCYELLHSNAAVGTQRFWNGINHCAIHLKNEDVSVSEFAKGVSPRKAVFI